MTNAGSNPEPGGPITSEKLRWLAAYCDLADEAFKALAQLLDQPLTLGDDVQKDLRRWADELDATT
jgi:hypothetical protein